MVGYKMAQNLSEPLVSNPSTSSSSTKGTLAVIVLGVIGAILYFARFSLFYSDPEVSLVAQFLHESPAYKFAFSPYSTILATVTETGSVEVWKLETKVKLAKFTYPGKPTAIAVTYNDEYVVVGGDDKTVRVFNLKTLSETAKFEHPNPITALQIPFRDTAVATICNDSFLRVWDLEEGKLDWTIETTDDIITAFDFDETGYKVALGTKNGVFELWDLMLINTKTFDIEFNNPIQQVKVNSYYKEASILLENGTFKVTTTEKVLFRSKDGFEYKFKDSLVALSEGSWYAVVGGETIQVIDMYYEEKIANFKHGSKVTGTVITPDGRNIISASDDKVIRVWSVRDEAEITNIKHEGIVKAIVLSDDLEYFATGSDDGNVRVYTLYP